MVWKDSTGSHSNWVLQMRPLPLSSVFSCELEHGLVEYIYSTQTNTLNFSFGLLSCLNVETSRGLEPMLLCYTPMFLERDYAAFLVNMIKLGHDAVSVCILVDRNEGFATVLPDPISCLVWFVWSSTCAHMFCCDTYWLDEVPTRPYILLFETMSNVRKHSMET